MSESIYERLQADMTAAMKAKDSDTLSTLRMLKAAILEAKTKKPKDAGVSHEEEIEILQRYAKKRRETIEELRKVGREDLVLAEEREIAVTARYLPQAVSEDELRALVRATIEQTGASGPKEMGKVIGAVMAQVKGRADGSLVSKLVKESLAG
jgi:uncharacterized protein